MCDTYILLQLRGTTRIDPPHSIHTRTGSGKIGEERRRSSLTRGLARASPGRSCCSCARASSCSFVRASSLASLASLLSSLRSLGTFVIGRSSWGARTKLLLAVLSGLRSGPEECQQRPAETRRIAAANCADCVPRIAPTAPNRCDADLADTTAADTENAHYTRREPGVRVVDCKVTSTQDSIQVVSRHCLCVTHWIWIESGLTAASQVVSLRRPTGRTTKAVVEIRAVLARALYQGTLYHGTCTCVYV